MKRSFRLAVVLMVWSPNCLLADPTLMSYDTGMLPCETYIKSEKGSVERLLFDQYVNGFLTGAGVYDRYDMPGEHDREGWVVWLTKHCEENPLDHYWEAVYELHLELKARNPG